MGSIFRLLVLLATGLCMALAKIRLLEFTIPYGVEDGKPIVFNCSYICDSNNSDYLEMKWVKDTDYNLIYQWIPGQHKPSNLRVLSKAEVKLVSFKPDDESLHGESVVRMDSATTDLQGNYTCKIDTSDSVESVTKELIVYKPPVNGIDFHYNETDGNATCSALDVRPEPLLRLYVLDRTENLIVYEDYYPETIKSGSTFSVFSVMRLMNVTLPKSYSVVCEFYIPGTEFVLKESESFYRGSSYKISSNVFIIFSTILSLMFLQSF